MIMADYSREWKRYQREFTRHRAFNARNRIVHKALGSVDRNKYKQLQSQTARQQESQRSRTPLRSKAQQEARRSASHVRAHRQDYRNTKAKYDTEKYDLDEAVAAPQGSEKATGSGCKQPKS